MINDLASGVYAASSRARVFALLVHARLVLRAVRADHALGPAHGRRAHVALLARAHSVTFQHFASTIRSAR